MADLKPNSYRDNSVEFLKWCNAPIWQAPGMLGFEKRATPQFPEYTDYVVINEKGEKLVSPSLKVFWSPEELYEEWQQSNSEENGI